LIPPLKGFIQLNFADGKVINSAKNFHLHRLKDYCKNFKFAVSFPGISRMICSSVLQSFIYNPLQQQKL